MQPPTEEECFRFKERANETSGVTFHNGSFQEAVKKGVGKVLSDFHIETTYVTQGRSVSGMQMHTDCCTLQPYGYNVFGTCDVDDPRKFESIKLAMCSDDVSPPAFVIGVTADPANSWSQAIVLLGVYHNQDADDDSGYPSSDYLCETQQIVESSDDER